MDLPNEFKTFCRGFHQDIHLSGLSFEELIESSIAILTTQEKLALKEFLRKSLAEPDSKLEKIWNASPADVFIRKPSQIRLLFAETIKRL